MTKAKDTTPAAPADHAPAGAGLDAAFASGLQDLETGAPDPLAPAAPLAPDTALTDARETIDFIADPLCLLFPDVQPIWSEETRRRLAEKWAPVFRKYGWSTGSLVEMGAIIATLPPLVQTVIIVRLKLAQLRAERQKAADDAAKLNNAQPANAAPT